MKSKTIAASLYCSVFVYTASYHVMILLFGHFWSVKEVIGVSFQFLGTKDNFPNLLSGKRTGTLLFFALKSKFAFYTVSSISLFSFTETKKLDVQQNGIEIHYLIQILQ